MGKAGVGTENGTYWDREAECADAETRLAMGERAWEQQRDGLLDRSPFYRRKYEDAGVDLSSVRLSELGAVPVTTKDELRRAQEEHPPFGDYLGVEPDRVKLIYQTSGTTGRPNVVALTASDIDTWTTIGCRSTWASGVRPDSAVLTTFGAGPFVAGTTHFVLERIGARRVPVGPGDTERVVAAFGRGLVDTFLGTPSFGLYLVRRFEEQGVDPRDFGIRHIMLGGEPGAGIASVRDPIEAAFGAFITESMGLGDLSIMLWGECEEQGGMHFEAHGLVWVELVDPETGESVDPEVGVVAEPVYTSLRREAMPLVRYRSGDLVEVQGTDCGCGRTGFRIRCIGRSDDMLIVRGVNIYPSAIQAIVGEHRPAVTGRSRVRLPAGAGSNPEPPLNVEVEYPRDGSPDAGLADAIESALRARLTFRARVSFVPDDEFGPAGYKTRAVVREA